MKKLTLLAGAVLALAAGGASADIVGFGNEFSGGVKCANLVTGCATLETTAIAGGVHFEFTGTMTGTEFITGLYGNIDPYAAVTVANLTGATDAIGSGFSFAPDGFKADGDGFFDWFLDLSSNPPRFDGTDKLSWDFLGVTLAQVAGLSQGGSPGKDGFQFAIHAQGLANGGSGWDSPTGCPDCVPTPVGAVPEPETWAMAGLGFALMGAYVRRKKKQQNDARLVA